MKNIFSKKLLSIIIVLGVLAIDQIIKIEVKTNMFYNESIRITNWFYLHFVENSGMALGIKIIPKTIQITFRIIFACAIVWYITKLIKANYKRGYIICISLILAGAIGNIIDNIFYGVIFSESTFSKISTFVPIGHGYTNWFHGKVVDMFSFPLFSFNWPDWLPFVGGDNFIFFGPIFNFADASICCGMFILLLFYTKDFSDSITLAKNQFKIFSTKAH